MGDRFSNKWLREFGVTTNNTEIFQESYERKRYGDDTVVRLHDTNIVRWNSNTITLDVGPGNWRTVTTKARMNEVARGFGLRFTVWQDKFDWYVSTPAGETLRFDDRVLVMERLVPVNI